MRTWLFIFLLFVGSVPCLAQVGITALPFLQIEPTAQAVMTGGASSAKSTLQPASFFYNPAHLGQIGYHNTTSASGYYKNMDWLPSFGGELTYRHWAIAGGINLSNSLGIPLSLGIGYIRSDLNLGQYNYFNEWENATGEFTSSEHFNMVGVGLHLDLPVNVSVGYSTARSFAPHSRYRLVTGVWKLNPVFLQPSHLFSTYGPMMNIFCCWQIQRIKNKCLF